MPGKTPHKDGKKPVENGIRSKSQDVDMKEDPKGKGKKAANKDSDEEMTVVVKTLPAKSSAAPDADGDVAMDGDDSEVKVDPVVQTVTGEFSNIRHFPPPAGGGEW